MITEYIQERYTKEDLLKRGVNNFEDAARAWYKYHGDQDHKIAQTTEGFQVFSIEGDSLIIWDMYVKPEYRRTKAASQLAEILCRVARSAGCRLLIGFTELEGKNQDMGIKAMKSFGMKPVQQLTDKTVYMKGI